MLAWVLSCAWMRVSGGRSGLVSAGASACLRDGTAAHYLWPGPTLSSLGVFLCVGDTGKAGHGMLEGPLQLQVLICVSELVP